MRILRIRKVPRAKRDSDGEGDVMSSSFSNYPLEGDGVIDNLFYYLWMKDELDQGPKINIPDTIIYKYRQPAYWYFTAKKWAGKEEEQVQSYERAHRRNFYTEHHGVGYYCLLLDDR